MEELQVLGYWSSLLFMVSIYHATNSLKYGLKTHNILLPVHYSKFESRGRDDNKSYTYTRAYVATLKRELRLVYKTPTLDIVLWRGSGICGL